MNVRKLVTMAVLIVTAAVTTGAASPQATRSPRENPPTQRGQDPTNPTTRPQPDGAANDRFEREFGFRRRYWRPVLRIGQDYALRANEVVRDVTVVFGSAKIDGRVEGDLVVIFGPVTLSNTAVVEGSFVVVGGNATVQAGAIVRDEVMVIGAGLDVPENFIFGSGHFVIGTRALGAWMESVVPWVTYGFLWGRPIVASIGWVWNIVGLFLLVYLLINLVAHEPVTATASVLATRPLGSFMTGLLVLLLAGPVSALLAVSIIGIAVIPFALAALVVAGLVGRVGVLRAIGNTVMRPDEPASRSQGLRSFVIGFALVTLTYMVPLLGFVAWALFGVLGLGAAVLAFLTAWRREHPKVEKAPRFRKSAPLPTPPAEPAPSGGFAFAAPAAPVVTQAPAFDAGPTSMGDEPADSGGWQPTMDAGSGPAAAATMAGAAFASNLASFPRAAFLDRAAAFVVDVVLLLFVSEIFDRQSMYRDDDFLLPLMLLYFIGFWVWKGTTIGGIVANLRVVKTNGGELSFLEGLVRGLTSVLSFGALGIGVLWILRSDLVAADGQPARQAWHDLAAGTYVVKVPKGYPLP
ncbi:MAG: RDD family protein [Acidobacteria bacterium]|nr:RDD family protein [Acidobacteriota bacterium]